MPMYYPDWSRHDIEAETDATLAMCGEDLSASVSFGFYAEVEVKWSIYDFDANDPNDYPEPPSFVSLEVLDLTLYINGEEAHPGDTLYSLCGNWAEQQIEYYDYEANN